MLFFRSIITLLAVGKNASQGPVSDAEDARLTTYEVCLSPGCIADGAKATLEKMKALAPPGILVKEGGCAALCGNGPIVICQTGRSKINQRKSQASLQFKKVSGGKLLDLFSSEENDTSISSLISEVEKGYDLKNRADKALSKEEYASAIQLYEEAMAISLAPSIELQTAREKYILAIDPDIEDQFFGLEWVVRARCNQAKANLALGNFQDAKSAAQAGRIISPSKCTEILEILAEINEKLGDVEEELRILRELFESPVDESKLTFSAKNARRKLGFRLAKLERIVK